MSAFVPRTVFAAPFVVTIAAAACHGAEAPTEAPVTGPADASAASASASVSASASAPAAASASAAPSASASVAPSASASVPPPRVVRGPDGGVVQPPPKDKRIAWTVAKHGTTCTATRDIDCDAYPCVVTPTLDYACPPKLPAYPARVKREAFSAVCLVNLRGEMECPPASYCNPPPPDYVTVPCPE